MADDVDPRTEADARIAGALQIVVDAGDSDSDSDSDAEDEVRRDYTPEELETLFHLLNTAMLKLRKLPGGKEAFDRCKAHLSEELGRRPLDAEAVEIVKRTFGDDVDLSYGTVGHHFVKMVTIDLKNLNALREKIIALAIEIRQD